MNEFLEQFLIESRELVEQATADLLRLEQDPGNSAVLDSGFRAFHTLKGAASIMDFTAMADLTHSAEDLLVAVRSGERKLTAATVTHCLSCLDRIVAWLDVIETTEALPQDAGPGANPPEDRVVAPDLSPQPAGTTLLPGDAIELLREQVALISLPPDPGYFGRLASAGRVCRNVLRHFGLAETASEIETALALLGSALLPETAPVATPPEPLPPNPEAEPDAQSAATRSLRVDVGRIEAMVKISGELIVAKNSLGHIAQSAATADPKTLAHGLQQLHGRFNRLTAELLRMVLATRVLQLQRVFQRFPRLVREMAARLDKPVRLLTEGESTEADKVIVEGLFEPILHVLRNAMDHGIESRDRRRAAGKPELAAITLRGRRDGDQVVIEVADDGAGIDLDIIRDTAIRRRLITRQAAAQMPDAEILDLIFLPGFSTAATVTDISGRGVGMDAVRAAVKRLGGRVVLQSRPGIGTTVRFVMPFTVLMTRVLTLHAGGQIFGVPLDEVVETAQLAPGGVHRIGAAEAVVLHGRTIPLISLTSALDLAETRPISDRINAVVVMAGEGELAALRVDRVGGQLDIILKPMEGLLAGVPGIAGSSLMGDGQVLIVLELRDLLR